MKTNKYSIIILYFIFTLIFLTGCTCKNDKLPYVFVTKWGKEGNENGKFTCLGDITLDLNGNILVVDDSCIKKFDSEGNFLTKWGIRGKGDVQLEAPGDIAVDREGNIYVTDTIKNIVQKFDSTGKFIFKIGNPGCAEHFTFNGKVIAKDKYTGAFDVPYGITLDAEENILVTDIYSIQKFSPDGTFITRWQLGSWTFYKYLENIAIDSTGYIYVVYYFTDASCYSDSTICKLDKSGKIIKKWKPVVDNEDNNIVRDIEVDLYDNILMSVGSDNCIQKFDSNGNFITRWGTKGNGDGQFFEPGGIAIDHDGNVYVADSGNHRIQKFAPNPDFKPEK